jgi:hypothetical protein
MIFIKKLVFYYGMVKLFRRVLHILPTIRLCICAGPSQRGTDGVGYGGDGMEHPSAQRHPQQ